MIALSRRATRRLAVASSILALAAASGLAVTTLTVGLPTDPEDAGLTFLSEPLQVGLALVFGLAGLAVIRWPAAAAVVMALVAAALGVLASIQYAPLLAVLLTVALLIPAILAWLAWQPTETAGSIATVALVTATLLSATVFGARTVHGHYFGPTHPDSSAASADFAAAEWLWLGGVSATDATIVAGGLEPSVAVRLDWSTTSSPADVRSTITSTDEFGIARFLLDGLAPSVRYGYRVLSVDDSTDHTFDAEFRTQAAGAEDLKVVFGSCARTGTNGAVFDAMATEEADLVVLLGDFHYSNLDSPDPADHLRAYAAQLSQPGVSQLLSSTPSVYVWDDHDFGPNDADSTSPSRDAVSTAYRAAVPDYAVSPSIEAPVSQAFTIGRVRFILTDTRSHRESGTMLGADQLDWFLNEVASSTGSHAIVVWANPTPWIAPDGSGADDWSAFAQERRAIADWLVEKKVDNLVMVSGDAHMVAIDDGTNSDFSTSGDGGFPVLHAAALDRPGSVKGGPYSHGTFPGPGQYGVIEVSDDGGDTIDVTLAGRNWEGAELVRFEYAISVG